MQMSEAIPGTIAQISNKELADWKKSNLSLDCNIYNSVNRRTVKFRDLPGKLVEIISADESISEITCRVLDCDVVLTIPDFFLDKILIGTT